MMSFRLLTEYHSFLFSNTEDDVLGFYDGRFRLLTEYHSFLFTTESFIPIIKKLSFNVSVSLRSIIHSYVTLSAVIGF